MTDAQLQALVAVADHGSFTGAARALGMTQSAVSHAVTGLEQDLRVTLLNRSARGVRLTEVGERTVEHARTVLQLKATIRQEADAARVLGRGMLRVGSFGSSASRRLLPPLIEAFERRHPGITVVVTEGTDPEVEQWIATGKVDVGFVTLPNEPFDTLQVAEDELLVVLHRNHPLAAEARIRPEQLAGTTFVMPAAGCELLIARVVPPSKLDVRYHIRDIGTIMEMVARGAGISIEPELALPAVLPPEVVLRPMEPRVPRRVALAVRSRTAASPACRAFLKIAAAQVRGAAAA